MQEKRRWDAVKIKALTGDVPIAARFMRADFFTYTPEFKLLLAGNHKPGLSAVDEAWRRRFNLIPFAVTIPKDERDPDLTEKLKPEWPGILQWAIGGCRLWAERGLDPPTSVVAATEAYFAEQDSIGRWIEEECALDPVSFRNYRQIVRRMEGMERARRAACRLRDTLFSGARRTRV